VNAAVPPAEAISFSIVLPSELLLSVNRTDAPCWANSRAVAAPIPEAPPVTMATLPKSLLPGSMVRLLFSSATLAQKQGLAT
jgi:hypothetical protein